MHKKKPKKSKKQRKGNEKNEKRKEKNKGQPNPLTCVNLTFLLIGPMPLHTLIVPYKKMFF
jgi:hypothetical protein